jgi:phosphotransferase system  glucose/maltose/N-acetylglucosamine-specific IIC component
MALMGLFFGVGGSTGSLIAFSIYGMLATKNLIWGIWGAFGLAILPGYFLLLKFTRHKNDYKQDAPEYARAFFFS